MIRFACQQCQKIFKVEDKHAGQKSKCPKCGAVLLIPSSEASQRQVKDSSLPLDKNKVPTPPSSKISDDDIFDIMNNPNQRHSNQDMEKPVDSQEKMAIAPAGNPSNYSTPLPDNKQKKRPWRVLVMLICGTGLVLLAITFKPWLTGNVPQGGNKTLDNASLEKSARNKMMEELDKWVQGKESKVTRIMRFFGYTPPLSYKIRNVIPTKRHVLSFTDENAPAFRFVIDLDFQTEANTIKTEVGDYTLTWITKSGEWDIEEND